MTGRTIRRVAALSVLFLSGCDCRCSSGLLIAPAGNILRAIPPNVKVHWDRPEFLYINAAWYNYGPIRYSVNSNGTLDSPFTRYDIDNNMPPISAQFATYIDGLTVSPDHRTVYFAWVESDEPLNHVSRYCVGKHGVLVRKQVFTEGDSSYSLTSMAFTGQGRFLYILYDQYRTSQTIPEHKVLVAYRFGIGGRVKRLPGPPVVAATYKMAAVVANPLIVVACAITGPSVRFLYVVRPEDHFLDIYRIKPSGAISTPPIASLALGCRAGKSVFCPSGHILYMADADHSCIMTYQIGTNGLPVRLPGTMPGTDPVLGPRGRFLYAAAPGNRSLLCYSVLPDGTLRLQGTSPTKTICTAPCVDATGRFVYALGQDPVQLDKHVISQFRITGNGTLMPLQPEQVPAVGSTTLITAQ